MFSSYPSMPNLKRPLHQKPTPHVTPANRWCLLIALCAQLNAQTWISNPADGNWNNPANWSPGTVPNTPSATATLGATALSTVTHSSGAVQLGNLVFQQPAPAYAIAINNGASLEFSGAGISNLSDQFQNLSFTTGGTGAFRNGASAGDTTITTFAGSAVTFRDQASAASATLIADGSSTNQGRIFFWEGATAANASITNRNGGYTYFGGGTAGTATITSESGSFTQFLYGASGGNASIVTNAGALIDISFIDGPSMTVGSIAGAGNHNLGAHNLITGSNNTDTTVSGAITDGGVHGGTGASLTKVGTGTLTLSGANTYSGGTTIAGGTLAIAGDASLGAAGGSVTLQNNAVLLSTVAFDTTRNLTVGTDGGTIDANASYTNNFRGLVSGPGQLTLRNTAVGYVGPGMYNGGNIALHNANTYSGGTVIYGAPTPGATTTSGFLSVGALHTGALGTGPVTNLGHAQIVFSGPTTSAEGLTITNVGSSGGFTLNEAPVFHAHGGILFQDSASAGNAHLINATETNMIIRFIGATRAGTATIDNFGGLLLFAASAQVEQATITNRANVVFQHSADLGAALVTNEAKGSIYFVSDVNHQSPNASTAAIDNQASAVVNLEYLAEQVNIGSLSGAGNVVLGTKSLTLGSLNRDDTISGIISGPTGSLTKIGTGILTLAGDNTYTGITTVAAGTLQLGNGDAAGSVPGDIVNHATLVFNRGTDLTHAGVISGSGSLTKTGAGNVTLTAQNTYMGATTVSAGTLTLGHLTNTLADTGAVVVNGGTLALGANSDTVNAVQLASGSITGTGALTSATPFDLQSGLADVVLGGSVGLTKSTGGTAILGQDNTYTGSTTVSAGTLMLGTGGTTGSVAGDIFNHGTLVFNRSDSFALNGDITGTGSMAVIGGGSLMLAGQLSLATTLTVGSGTLTLGHATNTLNDASSLVVSGGTLALGANSDTVNAVQLASGSITGTGTLTSLTAFDLQSGSVSAALGGTAGLVKTGAGMVTLTGQNRYTGTTFVNAGTLALGHASNTLNDASSLAVNGGILWLDANSEAVNAVQLASGLILGTGTLTSATNFDLQAGAVGAALGGNVGLVKAGTGTVVLSGTNTYTGTTSINTGTLELGAGGTTGSVAGNITNNGTLIFNRSDDVTFSHVLSGTGTVTKLGAGMLRFTKEQTLTGQLTISAGTLQLDGISVGSTHIASGARLQGLGTVRDSLTNEGTVSPGNSPGTVTVAGNFAQASSGRLVMELANATSFDRLVVQGSASLAGTLEVIALPGFAAAAGQSYQLLSANSVSGQFAAVVSPTITLPAAIKQATTYSSTSVSLAFQQIPYATFATTPNQAAFASALDVSVASGQMPELQARLNSYAAGSTVTSALQELATVDYARWHDTALSGAESTLRIIRGQASDPAPNRIWAQVGRRKGDYDANATQPMGALRADGIVVGYDRGGRDASYGAYFSNEDLDFISDSRMQSENRSIGLTGLLTNEAWQSLVLVERGWSDQDSSRLVSLPGSSQMTSGSTSARHWFAAAEAAYSFPRGTWNFVPSAGLQYFSRKQDGFTETGATLGTLQLADSAANSLVSHVGLNVSRRLTVGSVSLIPSFHWFWRHEFRNDPRALRAEIGGQGFMLQNGQPNQDGWEGGLQLTAECKNGASLSLRYVREESTAIDLADEFTAGFSYRF